MAINRFIIMGSHGKKQEIDFNVEDYVVMTLDHPGLPDVHLKITDIDGLIAITVITKEERIYLAALAEGDRYDRED